MHIAFHFTPASATTEWPQTWKTWNTQGFLWTWKTRGILCKSQDKNCNKQNIFSSSLKYLVRMRWWPVILLELMWNDPWWRSLLHLLFVAITYGKVSLWLWKSVENSITVTRYYRLSGHLLAGSRGRAGSSSWDIADDNYAGHAVSRWQCLSDDAG